MRKLTLALCFLSVITGLSWASNPMLYDVKLYNGPLGISHLSNGSYAVACNFDISTVTDPYNYKPGVMFFDSKGNLSGNVYGWDTDNTYDTYHIIQSTALNNSVFVLGKLDVSQASSIPYYVAKYTSNGLSFMKEFKCSVDQDPVVNGITSGNNKVIIYGRVNNGNNIGFFTELDSNGVVIKQQETALPEVVGACFASDGGMYIAATKNYSEIVITKFDKAYNAVFTYNIPVTTATNFQLSLDNTPVLIRETADGNIVIAAEITGGSGGFERKVLFVSLSNSTGTLNKMQVVGDGSMTDKLQSLECSGSYVYLGIQTEDYGFGGSDLSILTLSSKGTFSSAIDFGGENNEEYSLVYPVNGVFFVVGQTNSFNVSHFVLYSCYNISTSRTTMRIYPTVVEVKPVPILDNLVFYSSTNYTFSDFSTDNDAIIVNSFDANIPSKRIFSNTIETSTDVNKLYQKVLPGKVMVSTAAQPSNYFTNYFINYDMDGNIASEKTFIYDNMFIDVKNEPFNLVEGYTQLAFLRKAGTTSLLTFTSKSLAPITSKLIAATGNTTYNGVSFIGSKGKWYDEFYLGGSTFSTSTLTGNLFFCEVSSNSISSSKSLPGTTSSKFISTIPLNLSKLQYMKYTDNQYYLINDSSVIKYSCKLTTSTGLNNEHILKSKTGNYILFHEVGNNIEFVTVSKQMTTIINYRKLANYALYDIKQANDGYIYMAVRNRSNNHITVIKLTKDLTIFWAYEYLADFYSNTAPVDVVFSTENLDGFAMSVLGERNAKKFITTIVAGPDGETESGCQRSYIVTPTLTTTTTTTYSLSKLTLTYGSVAPTISDYSLTASSDLKLDYSKLSMGLNFTTRATDVSCAGMQDGKAEVILTQGTRPITVTWDHTINGSPVTGETLTNLGATEYTGYVTDAFGCSIYVGVEISEPSPLLSSIDVSNVSCHGFADGTATAAVSGGTPPYFYSWSNGMKTPTIGGLYEGVFNVNIFDNNGCAAATQTAVITQPDAFLLKSVITSDARCPASTFTTISYKRGTAVVLCEGGKRPYLYKWQVDNNGSVVQDPSFIEQDSSRLMLLSGTYTVTVQDACGKELYKTFTIKHPESMSFSEVTPTSSRCNGEKSKVSVVVQGGVLPYIYSFEGSNNTSNQPFAEYNANDNAVTINVSVTDSCGIVVEQKATIPSQPLPLVVNSFDAPVINCFGKYEAPATANVSGGTSPYQYMWNNGQTAQTALALPAGDHSVQVVDANGCITSGLVKIQQYDKLTAYPVKTDATCYGIASGRIEVITTGGKSPISYKWNHDNMLSTNLADKLIAGSYSMVVHDACADSVVVTSIVDQPQPLVVEKNTTELHCYNEETASILISASGGIAPYTYKWSDTLIGNTKEAKSLKAGKYYYSVTDGCNQVITDSVTFVNPSLLDVSVTKSNASCSNSSDGWISLVPVGGTAPYSTIWSFGTITDSLYGLFPGLYHYSIHDANGCTTTGVVEVGKPTELSIELTPHQTVCKQDTGKVITSVNGGNPPYTFKWSNNSTSQDLLAVSDGNYSITVTDKKGCTISTSTIVPVFIKQYPICMVTVDSASKANKIIWEKDNDASVAGWKIYCYYGKYREIGYVSASSAYSVYNDFMAKPRQISYQYTISTVDKCGNESGLSYSHSTMLMWSNYSTEPNKANIEWTPYDDESHDFSPEQYFIYKGNSYNNMSLIDSVPGSSSTYIDVKNDGAKYYRVGFKKDQKCVVTGLKSDSGPYSQSLSNMAESELLTRVAHLEGKGLLLTVFPIPAKETATISVKNDSEDTFELILIDVLGKESTLAKNVKQRDFKLQLNVTDLNAGQYLVQIKSAGKSITKKLVVVK